MRSALPVAAELLRLANRRADSSSADHAPRRFPTSGTRPFGRACRQQSGQRRPPSPRGRSRTPSLVRSGLTGLLGVSSRGGRRRRARASHPVVPVFCGRGRHLPLAARRMARQRTQGSSRPSLAPRHSPPPREPMAKSVGTTIFRMSGSFDPRYRCCVVASTRVDAASLIGQPGGPQSQRHAILAARALQRHVTPRRLMHCDRGVALVDKRRLSRAGVASRRDTGQPDCGFSPGELLGCARQLSNTVVRWSASRSRALAASLL